MLCWAFSIVFFIILFCKILYTNITFLALLFYLFLHITLIFIAFYLFLRVDYLRAIHIGPYQKIGDTYRKMIEYSNENNLKVKNESIEFYLNDPKTTQNSNLETELLIPLE